MASEESSRKIETQQKDIDPISVCNIQLTSGTTSNPKAVLLHHIALINNAYMTGKRNELNTKHRVSLLQTPYFHVYGTIIGALASLHHGATLVIPDARFNVQNSINALKEIECSLIYGTPTMYVDLIAKCNEIGVKFDSLEIAVTGGAICPPQLLLSMQKTLGVRKLKVMLYIFCLYHFFD